MTGMSVNFRFSFTNAKTHKTEPRSMPASTSHLAYFVALVLHTKVAILPLQRSVLDKSILNQL